MMKQALIGDVCLLQVTTADSTYDYDNKISKLYEWLLSDINDYGRELTK